MSCEDFRELENPWFSYAYIGHTKFIKQFFSFYSGRYLEKPVLGLDSYVGFTAMHLACLSGKLNVVQLLVDKEITLRTHKDVIIELLPVADDSSPPVKTILHKDASSLAIAVARGHHHIVKFLLSYTATDFNMLSILTRFFTSKDPSNILAATLSQNKAILGPLLSINDADSSLETECNI